MVLEIGPKLGYQQNNLELKPGDPILMYMDGVSETLNNGGEEFGIERPKQCVLEFSETPASLLICHIQESIGGFSGSTALRDAITMVAIKRV